MRCCWYNICKVQSNIFLSKKSPIFSSYIQICNKLYAIEEWAAFAQFCSIEKKYIFNLIKCFWEHIFGRCICFSGETKSNHCFYLCLPSLSLLLSSHSSSSNLPSILLANSPSRASYLIAHSIFRSQYIATCYMQCILYSIEIIKLRLGFLRAQAVCLCQSVCFQLKSVRT